MPQRGRLSLYQLGLDNQWSVPLVGSCSKENESHPDYGSRRHGRSGASAVPSLGQRSRGSPGWTQAHHAPPAWTITSMVNPGFVQNDSPGRLLHIYVGSFIRQDRMMRKTTRRIYPDPLEISLQSLFCLSIMFYLYEIHVTKLIILK